MSQQAEQLVKMANQIARNIGPQDDVQAVAEKTAAHLQRFWTPAMREQLEKCAAEGRDELSPAVLLMLESMP